MAGWMVFAAALFVVSAAVHASTFFGVDPMAVVPNVMYIHLLLFLPVTASFYDCARIDLPKDKKLDEAMRRAPRWLGALTALCFVYAFVNFILFVSVNSEGTPTKQGDRYVLMNRSEFIREIDEAEFHQQQAYVARGFTGHWMLFSCASLTAMIGAGRVRRDRMGDCAPSGARCTQRTL